VARIVPLQNFWTKTNFLIGISDTRPTSISNNEYQQIVEDAITTWSDTLTDFANNNSQFSNLANPTFDVHRVLQENDDIQFRWWFSHQLNGLTTFNPELWEIQNVTIFLGKHHGPIRFNQDDAQPGDRSILRTREQIRSLTLHEFGHALGLGHCSYHKDLMFTGGMNQPDPRRVISNLDLEVLSQIFESNNQTRTSLTYQIPDHEWISVQR